MTVELGFLIAAFVLFVIEGVRAGGIVAAGLACAALAFIWQHLG